MTMKTGNNIPEDVNVIIEIPANSADPIKYEYDNQTLVVDRFLTTSMHYPCNYGFIPNTMSKDGDTLDALVITPFPLAIGCMINCRPIGILRMTDEAGEDVKIIAVPSSKVTSIYNNVTDIYDLDLELRRKIKHFFEHYKDLASDKWVKVEDFDNKTIAQEIIMSSIVAINSPNEE